MTLMALRTLRPPNRNLSIVVLGNLGREEGRSTN